MKRQDLRLAVPVAVAWIVVGACIAVPSALPSAAIIAWVVGGALLAVGMRTTGGLVVVTSLACVLAAVLLTSAMARAPARQPTELLEASDSGRAITATATVTQTVARGMPSFTVTLEQVTIGDRRLDVHVPARVFGRGDDNGSAGPDRGRSGADRDPDLGIGSIITVSGSLSALAPEDSVAFLLFPASDPEVVGSSPATVAWANELRTGFRDATAALPGDGGALLPGLAIGDTTAVSAELDASMKASSLSHLTAVSGANCAIVVAAIMIAGGAVGLSRGGRMALSVAVLAGFVVLVTPEPSVLRASVMALLVIANSWRGRPGRGLPILALAVLALLAYDPWLSREYGFILSVLATTGLLVLAGPLTGVIGRVIPTPIAAVIAVPLAAQLTCQPVLLLLSSAIPAYGVLANALAAPAAPIATMLGLVACLALPVAPGIGMLVAKAAWLPSAWIAAVSTFFSGIPGSSIPWLDGAAGVAALAIVTALCLVVVLPRRGAAPRARRGAAILLALAVVGGLGAVVGSSIRSTLTRPTDWQYAACDVGQGDAVVVRSAGEVALIDTGPDPALLSSCLDTLAIDRIDLLVLTHFDLDHVGGVAAVVGRLDRALLGPVDRPEAERIVSDLRRNGAEIEQVRAGAHGRLGDFRWTALWPRVRALDTSQPNDLGIVLRFDGVGECPNRCLSSVFLADIGEEAQRQLAASARPSRVDVVKVAHHGSADQSAPLYEALSASLGLISVGADNTYGHPTASLLQVLHTAGTAVARTDRQGLLLVAPAPPDDRDQPGVTDVAAPHSGIEIELWTERGG